MPRINAASLAEHRELTQKALLTAFDELLAERSLDLISLSDIAKRAGVARSTIYNYAADKAALLALAVAESGVLLQAEATAIGKERSVSAPQRIVALVRFLLEAFDSGARRMFALQSHLGGMPTDDRDRAAAPFYELRKVLADVIEDGIEHGDFAATRDVALDIDLISGMLETAIRRIAVDPGSTGQIIARTAALVLRVLGARDSLAPR